MKLRCSDGTWVEHNHSYSSRTSGPRATRDGSTILASSTQASSVRSPLWPPSVQPPRLPSVYTDTPKSVAYLLRRASCSESAAAAPAETVNDIYG